MLKYEVVTYIVGEKHVYGAFDKLFHAAAFAIRVEPYRTVYVNDTENDCLVAQYENGVQTYPLQRSATC